MNSKLILPVFLCLVLFGCKKEVPVDFSRTGTATDSNGNPTEPVMPVSGNSWYAVNAPQTTDSHVEAMAAIPNMIVYTMVYSSGSWGYFDGSSFNNIQDNPGQYSTLREYQIVDGKIYGMSNTTGIQNILEFDPNSSNYYYSGWKIPFYSSSTLIRSIEKYDDNFFIATNSAPYVRMQQSGSFIQAGSSFSGQVSYLKKYNGKLVAAGSFTTVGAATTNNVAMWNGSNWQPMGTGLNGAVTKLEVYMDKLIAIGSFTANGDGNTSCKGIAAWNGTSWEPLAQGIDFNVNGLKDVYAHGNQLFVGGDFTEASGIFSPYIAQWDGSTWKAVGGGAPAIVGNICVNQGKLYISNAYTSSVAGGNFFLKLQ